MTISLAIYADSGLTSLITSSSIAQASDGSSAAADRVVYFGSNAVGKKFQAASNPGVANITVNISDAATGSGVQAAHVKLATTQAGLAGATAGAALSLGTQVLSGAGNGAAVWMRVDTPALTAAIYTDVSLVTNGLVEVSQ